MKSKIYLAAGLFLLMLGSCIKNDIPMAKVDVEIVTFQVEGQVDVSFIDKAKREILVTLSELTDIENVEIIALDMRAEDGIAEIISPIKVGDKLNLSSPLELTFTTYQDHIWTIRAEQQISRVLRIENQIGEAVIDAASKSVKVYVPITHGLDNINVLEMKLGQEGSVITPDPATVKDFSQTVEFQVKYKNQAIQLWKVTVAHGESLLTGDADAWAKFAYVNGAFGGDGDGVTFEYREEEGSSWIMVPVAKVVVEGSKVSCKIEDLKPLTTYQYRVVRGTKEGEIESFTTEAAEQIPNMSFDSWYSELSGTKKTIWYANKDLSEANYIWDSGNKGVTLLSNSTTTPEESHVAVEGEGKKGVKLESKKVVIAFAAGSIYTGKFGSLVGLGASLNFGIPYYSRPLRMTGYYDYTPGTIDNVKAPYESKKGDVDKCHIYVILADRSEPFEINTTTATFIDVENDPSIIAYGELLSDQKTDGYKEFDIELKYRDSRKPTMAVVVATSSQYGDYFTGSTKSLLYLDELQFKF